MRSLSIALVHHPVLDAKGEVGTSTLTTIDVHDLSRSARTYGCEGFYIVHPIEAMTLLTMLRDHGLEPKRLRAVHGRASDKARVVLVESVPGKPGGLAVEPPFVETDGRGGRSAELAALLTMPRH